MRRAIAISFLLASRLALADADPDLAETYIETPLVDEVGARWELDGHLAGTRDANGDAIEGSVGAWFGLAHTKQCQLVGIGGQLDLRSGDRPLTIQQSATICFLAAEGGGYGAVDHRLEWDVVPRLLAIPTRVPGPQRSETIGVKLAGGPVPDEIPGIESRGGAIEFRIGVGWNEAHWDLRALFGLWIRDFTKRYADDGPPIHTEAFGMWVEGLTSEERIGMARAQTDVGGLHFLLAKIDGIRLGAGFRLGGRLGAWLAAAGSYRLADLPSATAPATSKDEKSHVKSLPTGEGGVWVEHDLVGSFVGKLAAEAKADPAWNGRMVVDERATASIEGSAGDLTARLAASIAYTHVISALDRAGFENGGVSFEASYELADGIDVRTRIEAGRSVYGPDATFDHPTWGTQAMVMLAGHIERGPR